MDIYWLLEYIKVFSGYIFLMFVWPTVVFRNHLRRKSKIYHFSFCVTVQIIIVNSVVLLTGLFHILNAKMVSVFFYGTFLIAVYRICKGVSFLGLKSEGKSRQIRVLQYFKMRCLRYGNDFWGGIRPRFGEYAILFVIIVYGMAYFSYGLFQVHSYGHVDMLTHHAWVNSLMKGIIFPEGIYPEAMHCFIYTLNALFGIQIYSIMLFLQCIHVIVFLVAGYCMLREVFHWRYTPILVLSLYLVMNFDFTYSMSRLQHTLPMEFGLHTQFLCALYLVRYLKYSGVGMFKGKILKGFWDENIFLFATALCASISVHYYTTIMAFVLCFSFAIFSIRKIICPRYLVPLATSVLCGCIVATLPMIGASISGIPFEGSISWGLNLINSNHEKPKEEIKESEGEYEEAFRGYMDPTDEDLAVIEKLPDCGQKVVKGIIRAERFVREIYKEGYQGMYWNERGERIFWLTVAIIAFCLIGRKCRSRYVREILIGYYPIILISILSVLIFAAYDEPGLGLMVLIPNQRFASAGHMVTLAVMMIPVDIMISVALQFVTDKLLCRVSLLSVLGIYVFANLLGIYHEYLSCVLARYNAAVFVTNSIIEEFPEGSYTVVSPIEEACQVEMYGKHEEIFTFIENIAAKSYSISTDYAFIYIEKKPIYRQAYVPNGPRWLGRDRDSQIKATEISQKAAEEGLSEYTIDTWWQFIDARTILESKTYEWCQNFLQKHPSAMHVYYEDENFVCYYFKQNTDTPYNLSMEY